MTNRGIFLALVWLLQCAAVFVVCFLVSSMLLEVMR